jgi:hypothetical protein
MEHGDAMMLLMVVCRRGTEFHFAIRIEDPSILVVTVDSTLLAFLQKAETTEP